MQFFVGWRGPKQKGDLICSIIAVIIYLHIGEIVQDLIKELQTVRPNAVSIRAAKAIQQLHALQQTDLAGRLLAERKLGVAEGELIELKKQLLQKNSNSDTVANSDDSALSPTEVKTESDEMSNG